MIKFRKIFSVIMAVTIALSVPFASFAEKPDWVKEKQALKWETNASLKLKDFEAEERIEELKILIEALEVKLELEDADEDYIDLYPNMTIEAAEAELEKLKEELRVLLSEQKNLRNDLKNLRKEIRTMIKGRYTQEELDALEAIKLQLQERYQGITVLDVDSIISESVEFKFDTPPVIKGGRTLIPVSALVKGFGAEVAWDPDTRTVTITKDDIVIVIKIDDNRAIVSDGGVVRNITMDTKATIMNSRTIVPLRFIAETLHLKVKWNAEDKTIEIDDDGTVLTVTGSGFSITTSTTTTGSAITIPFGTTMLDLVESVFPVENGSYTLKDGNGDILDLGDLELITDDYVVVSLAPDGSTVKTYSIVISPALTDTTLTVTGSGFSTTGSAITIPFGTTTLDLDEALSPSEKGSYTLEDKDGNLLAPYDLTLVKNDDIVVSLAQDGSTKETYTIVIAPVSTDATLTISGNGYGIVGTVITVPVGAKRVQLDAALTEALGGSYILKNKEGKALIINNGSIVGTDVVVSFAEDETTKVTYTIVVTP